MTDSALNLLGVDLDNTYVSAGDLPVEQGTIVPTRNGRAVIARAVSGIAQFSLVVITPSSAGASASVEALLCSTANCSSGYLAIAQTSVASAEYGWFHTEIAKEGRVRVSVGVQPNVQLYVTTTGGMVGAVTVSAGPIKGLVVLASAASASAPPCLAQNMVIAQNAGAN